MHSVKNKNRSIVNKLQWDFLRKDETRTNSANKIFLEKIKKNLKKINYNKLL